MCANPFIKIVIISLSLLTLSSSTGAGVLTDIEKELEQKRLLRLSAAKQGQQIQPFHTDGCSGGLSTGWEYFAGKFPKFSSRFGDTPPWETCCITHDLAYWQGETDNGYEARRQADTTLRTCVEQTGITVEDEPNDEVSLRLKITALLMYRAVRLGGKPCTSFAWRWGYGWPTCPQK